MGAFEDDLNNWKKDPVFKFWYYFYLIQMKIRVWFWIKTQK